MFTPPFNRADGKPLYPEMTRDAVLFGGTDPGRFCPTYMIFAESFAPGYLQAGARPEVRPARRLHHHPERPRRRHLPQLHPRPLQPSEQIQYDTPFFQELFRTRRKASRKATPTWWARWSARSTPLPGIGDRIEKSRRAGTSMVRRREFHQPQGWLRPACAPAAIRWPVSRSVVENLSPDTKKLID